MCLSRMFNLLDRTTRRHDQPWRLNSSNEVTPVEFIDENVDYTHWIGIANVVVEAFGKQSALATMFTLDGALRR